MKKRICLFLATVMTVCSMGLVTAHAKVGDVIGTALHTDIVAYVNHYAIPSYAVNGTSVIVAEDLRNFGFDVAWNGFDRTLSISRNEYTSVNQMSFAKTEKTGAKFTEILETDIKVYVEGELVTSYAMNGYTMIPVEELTMVGQVMWIEGERALKLWVDGLNVREEKQPIPTSLSTSIPAGTIKQSAMYKLATGLIEKGRYTAYDTYAYMESQEGVDIYMSYEPSTGDIGMSVSVSDDGVDVTTYVFVFVAQETGLNYEIEGYGQEYNAYGTFVAPNHELDIFSADVPENMIEDSVDFIWSCLEIMDIVLAEDFGVSIYDLGINY